MSLTIAGTVLVASVLISRFTGGAGLLLLVGAGIVFTLALGDLVCASYHWYNKAHGGEGLSMGSDAPGNLFLL